MSPGAFRQQMLQLLSELTRCYELCNSVRQNRRIGSKHEALDSLQDGLASSISGLQIEYDTQRAAVGARMDIGDEQARHEISHSTRIVTNDIRTRLEDIAFKRDSSDGHSSSSRGRSHGPRFRDLLKKWYRTESNVEDTLQRLSHRLEPGLAPLPEPSPKPVEKPSHKKDELVVSLKQLDHLLAHMKQSWEEKVIAGQLVYVNCFDASKTRWERPEGDFIKTVRRKQSWERTSPAMQQGA